MQCSEVVCPVWLVSSSQMKTCFSFSSFLLSVHLKFYTDTRHCHFLFIFSCYCPCFFCRSLLQSSLLLLLSLSSSSSSSSLLSKAIIKLLLQRRRRRRKLCKTGQLNSGKKRRQVGFSIWLYNFSAFLFNYIMAFSVVGEEEKEEEDTLLFRICFRVA